MLKIIKFTNFPKNLLILSPFIIGGVEPSLANFVIILQSLLIFFLLTSFCYLINDYKDQEIDKKNILKKNINIEKKTFISYLSFLSILFILALLIFNQTNNYFIYIYLINFLLYNYIFKKIIILDILLLINFYLIRIFYGSQIFDLDISIGFFIFSYSFFLFFSLLKRIIQIKLNNLRPGNKIIAYNLNHLSKMEIVLNLSLIINIFSCFTYYLFNLGILKYNNFFTNKFDLYTITLILVFYFVGLLRVFALFKKNQIKNDIFLFFIKDKKNYFLFFILILLLSIIHF